MMGVAHSGLWAPVDTYLWFINFSFDIIYSVSTCIATNLGHIQSVTRKPVYIGSKVRDTADSKPTCYMYVLNSHDLTVEHLDVSLVFDL